MATFKNPLLSPLSGQLGNLVIYQANGKTVIRGKPKWKSTYKPTPLQRLHQWRFKEAGRVLRPLKEVLDFGFSEVLEGHRKGIHLAMSHAMRKAFCNDDGEWRLNPTALQVSSGSIGSVAALTVAPEDTQKIQLRWESQGNCGISRESDLSWVIAYNPVQGRVEEFKGTAFRKSETLVLELSPRIELNGLLVFMAFYRKGLSSKVRFSDSVCVPLF